MSLFCANNLKIKKLEMVNGYTGLELAIGNTALVGSKSNTKRQ
jgi:hypothetical protein